ncbi:MAG: SRPBCC family protein [Flavisolibacter sp.]
MKNEPFVIERIYDAPIEMVWRAITDKNEMNEWYFDLTDFKAVPGFNFSFEGGTEHNKYVHLCQVTEVIPLQKLSYTWVYQGYEGSSHVIFELFEEGNQTRLRLTHEGLDSFPENPDFAAKNFDAGWTDFIGRILPEYLEKKTKS